VVSHVVKRLRRPVPDDMDAIFAIHSDPATCLHNPSDALSKREETVELSQRWDDRWRRFGYGRPGESPSRRVPPKRACSPAWLQPPSWSA
jgi:cell wall assembly regulator SMI1